MMSIKQIAEQYAAAGISILPIKMVPNPKKHTLEKKPNIFSWEPLQKSPPTVDDVDSWAWKNTIGLGLVCGEVNGGLEAIDFDYQHGMTQELYSKFRKRVMAERPDLLSKIFIQKTPSGGRHWIYRCDEISTNTKLCTGQDGEANIETRGERGYIHIVPTQGYEWVGLGEGEIPSNGRIVRISVEERQFLFDLARSGEFGVPWKDKKYKGVGTKKGKAGAHTFTAKEVPVFHDAFVKYNKVTSIRDLVEEDGWKLLEEGKDNRGKKLLRYERPGGDGVGASLYPDDNTFYVFTSASQLPQEQMMSPAEYVLYRDHDGDEAAMLHWLEEEGFFGEEEKDRLPDIGKTDFERDINARREHLKLVSLIKAIFDSRYNIIRSRLEMREKSKQGVVWRSYGHHEMQSRLLFYGAKVGVEKLKTIMMDEEAYDKVDPVVSWLEDCGKVGEAGAIESLAGYVKCVDQGRWVIGFKKHLVRCVRQLRLEGVNRYALILHSSQQGNGKSTFLRSVITAGPMGEYYSENLPKDGDPNAMARFLSMNVHANMEELDSFVKKDADTLKAMTTARDAEYRKLFTDAVNNVPRRINFWGSTNKSSFLSDVSNTRWLIHEVVKIDWAYSKVVDMAAVWGEAVQLYESGFDCDLGDDEIEANEEVSSEFKRERIPFEWVTRVFTPYEELSGEEYVALSPSEILNDLILFYETEANDRAIARELGRVSPTLFGTILRDFGMGTKRIRTGKCVHRLVKVVCTKDFLRSKCFNDSHAEKRGCVH